VKPETPSANLRYARYEKVKHLVVVVVGKVACRSKSRSIFTGMEDRFCMLKWKVEPVAEIEGFGGLDRDVTLPLLMVMVLS